MQPQRIPPMETQQPSQLPTAGRLVHHLRVFTHPFRRGLTLLPRRWVLQPVLAATLAVLATVTPLVPSNSSVALAATNEATPIWRAQVRLLTADVSDAGTDDTV